MIVSDHLWISWNSTSYIVLLSRWRYKMWSVSWFKDGCSQSPVDCYWKKKNLSAITIFLHLNSSCHWNICMLYCVVVRFVMKRSIKKKANFRAVRYLTTRKFAFGFKFFQQLILNVCIHWKKRIFKRRNIDRSKRYTVSIDFIKKDRERIYAMFLHQATEYTRVFSAMHGENSIA